MMKQYINVYRNSKGELNLALDAELLCGIFLIFLFLPLIGIVFYLWHFITGNTMLVTKEDYYKQRAEYHKRQNKRGR